MVEQVSTHGAPRGEDLPFPQGTIHDDTIYTSGQVGVDPETDEIGEGGHPGGDATAPRERRGDPAIDVAVEIEMVAALGEQVRTRSHAPG